MDPTTYAFTFVVTEEHFRAIGIGIGIGIGIAGIVLFTLFFSTGSNRVERSERFEQRTVQSLDRINTRLNQISPVSYPTVPPVESVSTDVCNCRPLNAPCTHQFERMKKGAKHVETKRGGPDPKAIEAMKKVYKDNKGDLKKIENALKIQFKDGTNIKDAEDFARRFLSGVIVRD